MSERRMERGEKGKDEEESSDRNARETRGERRGDK